MKIKDFNYRISEGTEFVPFQKPKGTLRKGYGINRVSIVRFGIILFALIILAMLIKLQIISGAYYRGLAENNRIRVKEIKPVRGIIYDRNNIPLVINKPRFSLLAIPVDVSEKSQPIDPILDELQKRGANKTELQAIEEKMGQFSYLPQVLLKNLTYEDGVTLLPTLLKWRGVYLQEHFTREYPYGPLLSHIIGYTGFVTDDDLKGEAYYSPSDITGRAGIELFFENQLRGEKGETRVEVNSIGKEDKLISSMSSQKGQDITLTLDLSLQKELEDILRKYMNEFHVDRSAAIVLDPKNGEILAMISLPTFDDNLFTDTFDENIYKALLANPHKPLFNRAISGVYPPGSTFKLIVGASALEENLIDEKFTVSSTGGIQVGQWFFPDWKPGGHGIVDIKTALAWSVNTFFYTIGGGNNGQEGLGINRIAKYADLFNLGKPTGIDLPHESSGFIPSEEWKLQTKNEPWYLGDTYHVSIGQGDILVTPLQDALWTSFFANHGTLYVPHIVKKEPAIIDKSFISSKNIDIIREGLRDTVRYGSARSLNVVPVTVAGKTGSAQFAENKKPHGWFTGFAPYDNPQIIITVLMEESGGSETAMPIARDFLNWYFQRLSIEN